MGIFKRDENRVPGRAVNDFDHGRNSDVDTSVEQLTTNTFECLNGILVKANINNTGIVYVGKSDMTVNSDDATDGFPLNPGEAVEIEVDSPDKVYVAGSANNQVVHWITT